MLDSDYDPLTFGHPLFFAQKCSKSAKSNPSFHLKERKDRGLTLTDLDSPMAEFFLENKMGETGDQSWTSKAYFGSSPFP